MLDWVDKQNNVDDVLAEDINDIAHSVIELEKTAVKVVDQTYTPDSENAQSGKAVAKAVAIEQKRSDNTFSNALRGSKSDTAMLLDDISPVTHDMGVKVRGKNLFDEKQITGCIDGDSEVEYSRYGEVIDGCLVSKLATYDRGTMWNGFKVYLEKNETYTLSADAYFGTNKEGTKRVTVGFIMKNSDGTLKDFTNLVTLSTWDKWEHITTQLNVTESGYYYLRLQATGGAAQYTDMDARFKNIQVEIGSTATAYTPYVPDLTAVKVSRCGKNLFDINQAFNSKGENAYDTFSINDNVLTATSDNSTTKSVLMNLFDGELLAGDYILSLNAVIENTPKHSRPNEIFIWKNGSVLTLNSVTKTDGSYSPMVKFTLSKKAKINISFYKNVNVSQETVSDTVYKVTLSNIQLELGTTVTEYEPYKECAEYTPNADGTVNGVTILYPNTTLMTDTEGVLIDCEYNRDLNKAFAALEAAIATNNN